jgi:hypothetical protein
MKEIPNAEERVRTIAKSYVESPDNSLIVSPDNASRRELNLAVRQELKANGSLAPEDHSFRVLVQRQDMTGAERSWASRYEINDVVRYTRGSKTIGIEAAAYASVVAINPAANLLTVEKANHELATYDPRRLTGTRRTHRTSPCSNDHGAETKNPDASHLQPRWQTRSCRRYLIDKGRHSLVAVNTTFSGCNNKGEIAAPT